MNAINLSVKDNKTTGSALRKGIFKQKISFHVTGMQSYSFVALMCSLSCVHLIQVHLCLKMFILVSQAVGVSDFLGLYICTSMLLESASILMLYIGLYHFGIS